jgi:hypothetical protein
MDLTNYTSSKTLAAIGAFISSEIDKADNDVDRGPWVRIQALVGVLVQDLIEEQARRNEFLQGLYEKLSLLVPEEDR